MNYYELIEIMKNFNDYEFSKALNQYKNIEKCSRKDLVDDRNLNGENASKMYSMYNEMILSINDEDTKVWYSVKELSEILGVEPSAVKQWKQSGRLKCHQEKENCKIEINTINIENFLFTYGKPEYRRRWQNRKK